MYTNTTELSGYLRADGRKGIRNVIAVAYLVECAHFVARAVVEHSRLYTDKASADEPSDILNAGVQVHLVGFPGCYPNNYADKMMRSLLTHPNIGGVLLVSLGCESFNRTGLHNFVANSGRPVHTLVIQKSGGTRRTIEKGGEWVRTTVQQLEKQSRVPMHFSELIVGTVCGGSDGTSGITANPAVGRAFDHLLAAGATCIFEETGELVGCEQHMAQRSVTPELAKEIVSSVHKAEWYYSVLGHGSFAAGNAQGGLTTQEEKSLGAYAKSGASQIHGILKPGDLPPAPGLYLLDVVPDGEVRFGFPNIADNTEIVELISCGAHLTLFTTGRGSVVGSAISPVIKICANPQTYRNLSEDMDVNAGRILDEGTSLEEVGVEIFTVLQRVVNGVASKSEELGHQEFLLGYKSFSPLGPACLPLRRATAS